jgi:alanine racemase
MSDCRTLSGIYRTCAEVDLDAIRRNGRIIRAAFPQKRILCVLKADAYGHGISGVLPAMEDFADEYAVATVDEALRVRAKSEKPVLLFGPVPEGRMAEAARAGLSFTVGSVRYAARLGEILAREGLEATCQLKLDTGLCRYGVPVPDSRAELLSALSEIYAHKNLRFRGTFTHFACGEGTEPWEKEFTALQFSRFERALEAMREAGFPTGICHCTSTGGSLVHPEYRMDMVRLGMMPLGMSYSDDSVRALGLTPALRWVSWIAETKHLKAGDAVSYGCTFRAERPMRIALVSCGYADGYRRSYSGKASVLVGGRRTAVLGRIAMDYLMIDVTELPEAEVGTEVALLGWEGEQPVSAQTLSEWGESVSGEVTAAISARVPRIYKEGSRIEQ